MKYLLDTHALLWWTDDPQFSLSARALIAGEANIIDPFDRMLAAQSQLEGTPLIDCDPALAALGVHLA